MAGFKNKNLNNLVEINLFEEITKIIIECLECMKKDCINKCENIPNHEEKIRNFLFEKYLKDFKIREKTKINKLGLAFIIETYESYEEKDFSYRGRVDIKIINRNFLKNQNNYYLIECKRIDGDKTLNEYYVNNGIHRFTAKTPKYSSYNNMNFMLVFVVRDINVESNLEKIKNIQEKNKDILIHENFNKILKTEYLKYNVYDSIYILENSLLKLRTIFFDLSCIVI